MRLRLIVLAGWVTLSLLTAIAAKAGQWAAVTGPLWFLVGIGYYHAKMDEL